MCQIPSPLFNAVFTGVLFGRHSLPPDFTNRSVKSLAFVSCGLYRLFVWSPLTSARFYQQICEIPSLLHRFLARRRLTSASFYQPMREIPSPLFNAVFTGFCLVAAHFRQIFSRFKSRRSPTSPRPAPPRPTPPHPTSPHPPHHPTPRGLSEYSREDTML